MFSTYLLYAVSFIVGSLAIGLYIFQCNLIYPASFPTGSRSVVMKPSQFGLPYKDVTITTKDNILLQCYLLQQKDEDVAKNSPTIIYFHANAGNMGHRLPIAKIFFENFGCNVFMLSYRGYGLSGGSPNEKGLKVDAEAALEYIKEHPVLGNTPLIAYGQSIGGAVAIYTVSRNEDKFSALILENTFLNMPELIPNVIPALRHFMFLCHQIWPSHRDILAVRKTPTLFLSGSMDELVPSSHMRKLYDLCDTRGPKFWKEFEEGTHNDTCLKPGYFEAIGEFIRDEVWKLVNGSMEDEKRDNGADKAPNAHVENGGANTEKDGM
ncbi:Alpha/Beta hydrolase protein [Umbelopsis sp. AD052]|nr:Alpha/Beta hydrolase protein [Umbelopsis sp. AD052]